MREAGRGRGEGGRGRAGEGGRVITCYINIIKHDS